jgi:ribosomal protein S18 acetylase RimI-like enzyme
MSDPAATRATLEELSFRAWPAEHVVESEGWRMRAMRGVTRRANSAWPVPTARAAAAATAADPEPAIARAEAFYAARHLPCMVHVSDDRVDAFLAARGYREEAPVSVQVADTLTDTSEPGADACTIERAPSVPWFEASASGRFAAVAGIYRGLLARLGERAAFARVDVDGDVAAVGLGVVESGWCGVFSMLTLAPYRRRGLARQLLAGLSRHARERGATRMYLQVERDNEAARALYASLGFSEAYGYHYRVKPAAP